MKKMKWAIVGTGYIANEFARGLQEVENAEIVAVVSRSIISGKAFGEKYNCKKIYIDFESMLKEETVDIVYIAIPNNCHYEYILKTIENKIAVLSEKPIVDNMKQLEHIFEMAVKNNVFVMEGMWTRCFPAVQEARKWIENGKIGEVLTVNSGFDIKPNIDEWQVWKGSVKYAGGALRDVGIYSLAMAYMAFQKEPEDVHVTMRFNGEVDESTHLLLAYENGGAAFVSGSFNQVGRTDTEIIGEKGKIVIGPEYWHPTTATIYFNDGKTEKYMETYPASGFQFEIQEVQRCVQNKLLESPCFTWNETKQIGKLIEDVRKSRGIYYTSDGMETE